VRIVGEIALSPHISSVELIGNEQVQLTMRGVRDGISFVLCLYAFVN
jgi:hypothetical protein